MKRLLLVLLILVIIAASYSLFGADSISKSSFGEVIEISGQTYTLSVEEFGTIQAGKDESFDERIEIGNIYKVKQETKEYDLFIWKYKKVGAWQIYEIISY